MAFLHRRRFGWLVVGVAVAMLWPSTGFAQQGAAPGADDSQGAHDAGPRVVHPVESSPPGVAGADADAHPCGGGVMGLGGDGGALVPPTGSLKREGTFLIRRRGRLVPADEQTWVFVFAAGDAGDAGDAESSGASWMALQPSVRLTEMRRVVESRPEAVLFIVSGQVFEYYGRNHLLPTFFTTVASDDGAAAGIDAAALEAGVDVSDTHESAGEDGGDVDVESLVARVKQATRPERPPPVQTTPTPKPRSDVPTVDLLREGMVLTSRRGRLVRGNAATWRFVVDNDVDTPSPPPSPLSPAPPHAGAGALEPATIDAPLTLLPCLNLQEMERVAKTHGTRVEFTISGHLFVYEGRNYLLPTMYLIERDRAGNLTTAQ